MAKIELFSQFKEIGRDLFLSGVVTARSGNLSQKNYDGTLTITRTGCLISNLLKSDLITVSLENGAQSQGASSEVEVHRAIVNNSTHCAVIHAHCPYTVALANTYNQVFADSECLANFGKPLLVGDTNRFIVGGYQEEIAAALKNHVVVVVAGHGVFAAGQTINEAYAHLSALEASSKLAYIQKTLK